jgi:MoxR-like ATPase
LPEAQLDRFMLKSTTDYPSREEELELLTRAAAGFDARFLERAGLAQTVQAEEVLVSRDAVRAVHASPGLRAYVYDIVGATRTAADVSLGASPRAGLHLLLAAQAAAAIDGRDFVTPDDVKDAAVIVLAHRLLVRPEAEVEGIRAEDVVARVLQAVAVPKDVAPDPIMQAP